MRTYSLSLALLSLTYALHANAWGESSEEAARRARSLLVDKENTFNVASLSTVYADNFTDASLRGHIASGPEYFAPCYPNGDVLMLAMPVSQNWRNVLQTDSKNATLSITSSYDPRVPDPRHTVQQDGGEEWEPKRPSWRRGMPSKQRLTLFGHFAKLEQDTLDDADRCYKSTHPDASHWTPDNGNDSPHVSFYVRFYVDRVYRVGGFGDESSIGWLDMDLWRRSSQEDAKVFMDLFDDNVVKKHTPSFNIETLFGESQITAVSEKDRTTYAAPPPPSFILQSST